MFSSKKKQYSFWYKNGLILAFLFLFVVSLLGQTFNGWKEFNDFLNEYHQPAVTYSPYLLSGHFIQATFENWESEFFQMALFVILLFSFDKKVLLNLNHVKILLPILRNLNRILTHRGR